MKFRKAAPKKTIHKDGDNLRNRLVRRGYLKKDEANDLIVLLVGETLMRGTHPENPGPPMWESWVNQGIMTKEQAKYLKTGCTFISKATQSILKDNLDAKSKDVVYKRVMRNEIRIIDDYMIEKLKRIYAENKEVQVSRSNFEVMCECMHAVTCRNCEKSRQKCDIHTFYENYNVPPVEYRELEKTLCNCEYAFEAPSVNEVNRFYDPEIDKVEDGNHD